MVHCCCGFLPVFVIASLLGCASAAVPAVSVTDVNFVDLDLDRSEFGGSVTWTAPADVSTVSKYVIYAADDASGTNEVLLTTNVAVGTNTGDIAKNTAVGGLTNIIVKTKNSDCEQTTTPGAFYFSDEVGAIGALAFEDLDLDIGEIGGVVEWTVTGTATVDSFNIYLADDGLGANKRQLSMGTVGTQYSMPADTPITTGSYVYVCAYAVSALGETNVPSAIQVYDLQSDVRNVVFKDYDLDADQLGGTITWLAPTDNAKVTQYALTRATDSTGTGRYDLSTLNPGTLSYTVSENTDLYSYTCIYSASSLAESTTPVCVSMNDAVASVSNIAFQDVDLDVDELAGSITFDAAPDASDVVSYNMYLAQTAAGGFRSNSLGTNSMQLSRSIQNTDKGSYGYFVVYTESSLFEQTTPTSFNAVDVASTPINLAFTDDDTADAELEGYLTWSAASDVSQVTGYQAYWATSSQGASKLALGSNVGVVDTLSVSIGTSTQMGSYTHFVVYAISTQGEQSTPASLSIFDLKWTTNTYGACSSSCGSGTQTRTVACSSGTTSDCDLSMQPDTSQSCTSAACSWNTGDWSDCSFACGLSGTQTRTVSCPGNDPTECGTEPSLTQTCFNLCPWAITAWSSCDSQGYMKRCASCPAFTEAGCGLELKPDETKTCVYENALALVGCGDNYEHSPMRPWGRDNNMSCTTQWWVIFFVIILTLSLIALCVCLCYMIGKKSAAAPKEQSAGLPEAAHI